MRNDSVVLITIDCLRADHVGCYGYDRPTTPNIDEFAEDATLYEHGYANCPGTRWAFQALQCGVYTHQINGIGIPDEAEPLSQQFKNQGYNTGAFANNGFLSRQYNYHSGFDTFRGTEDFYEQTPLFTKAGFYIRDLVNNERFSKHVLRPIYRLFSRHSADDSTGFKPSNTDVDTVDMAVDWIRDQQADNQPFFAWIHLMDAHDPYARWNSHLQALRGDTDIEHAINGEDYVEVGEEPPKAVIDAYDSGIRSADEQIGRILSLVDDDTIVAITGDHGEEFGQYKSFHSASLYSSMTQVPLIIRSPDLQAERVDSHWAQYLDIPPTLLSAANIDTPETWEGTVLQHVDRDFDDPVYFTVKDELIGVRRGNWKLFTDNGQQFELYDMSSTNTEDDPEAEQEYIKRDLEQLIENKQEYIRNNIIGNTGERLNEDREELAEEVQDSLEDLGYIDS